MEPLNPADPDLYVDFTSLKSEKLQTWIAIGGFDFSNPGTATHTSWSDMVGPFAALSTLSEGSGVTTPRTRLIRKRKC